ncbi:MAG: DUF4364 domain-containing protein [Thermoplasmata archaeon]|nr:DUF4364 domain-containing protein [Thermoplasmata archaeon]
MINNRRSEIDILADILELAKNGAQKTKILCRVNLNYTQLKTYLSFLVERKLLDERKDGARSRIYRTTDRGLQLLDSIKQVKSFLD